MTKIEILDQGYNIKDKAGSIKLRISNNGRSYDEKDIAEFYRRVLTKHLGYKESTKGGIEVIEEYDDITGSDVKSFGIRRLPNHTANIHIYKLKEEAFEITFEISVNGAEHLERLMRFGELLEEGKLEDLVLN